MRTNPDLFTFTKEILNRKVLKSCRENYATGKTNFAANKPEWFAPCEQTFLRDVTWSLAVFF